MAEITSIAVPATSKKLVSSNAWPTLATPLRSSHSRPRHKHVEPRSWYRREFVAWPEQVSFLLDRLSFAPPPCRMPLGQSQDIPQADPGGMATPRFWHRLNSFRHVISGSLAFASLDRACRNLVPAFPQRSPPRHLAAAACGGLRSAPDCRTRRALLHLSYSYAPPVLMAALVSHGQQPPWRPGCHAVDATFKVLRAADIRQRHGVNRFDRLPMTATDCH